MKQVIIALILFFSLSLRGQTPAFSFECVCGYISRADTTCDICTPTLQSRFFSGLLIRQSGKIVRWIDKPYTVKFSNNNATFLELIPNPDQITIALSGTPYATLAEWKEAISCDCNGGVIYTAGPGIIIVNDTISAVDTSATNELQVLSVSNDSVYLSLNGGYFVIAGAGGNTISTSGNTITITGSGGGFLPLPYFTGDTAALAAGLMPGDPYLLECNNDYDLPAGIFKVIKICSYDCTIVLRYYSNDVQAQAGDVPVGKEYVLDELNLYGVMYGFVKVVTNDTLNSGSLSCDTILPNYNNHTAAIGGGLTYGDHYLMSVTNTYGSPEGMNVVVSLTSSTEADKQPCCDEGNLPFYSNNTTAISGGLSSGDYYYLTSTNTYGFPYGTKKRIP